MHPGTPKTSTPEPAQAARISPTERLVSLIRQEQLHTAFQPIVCLQSGEIAGFEALARPFAETGYKGPADLFADAEHADLLWPLEELARAKSISAAADFPDGTLLFFNSTPRVFADSRFIDSVKTISRSAAIPPPRIVLEITEAAEQSVVEGLNERVKEVRGLGFQVAIDDVGAGTSGLNRLMLLRPQWLKLDRELIDHIDQDRFKHNLIRFLVHFARLSGVRVVAEGVERREELAALIALGVGYGQGYLLGKPSFTYQTIDGELAAWIRERWKVTQSPRHADARGSDAGSMASMAMPVQQVQSSAPIREVASLLLRSRELPGVAVMDGRRYLGWCPREEVLRTSARSDAGDPVGFITPSSVSTIGPDSDLADALELLSVREQADLASPLVIATGDALVGMVPLRSLLNAMAAQLASGGRRVDPLTGLPGRVAAEQRVRELIAERQGMGSVSVHTDAVFIDVRNFADFNGAFGYELGDQLILDLAALLRLVMNPGNEPGAISHLGVDRFLVTGAGHAFEQRLERLVTEFDASLGRGRDWTASGIPEFRAKASDGSVLPTVAGTGLRLLYTPNVFDRVKSARELFVIERQMRIKASRLEPHLEPGRSHLVRDQRTANRAAHRQAA
ncbi:MAG: EAL domain-containing protein [Phycisphaerales bacterium]